MPYSYGEVRKAPGASEEQLPKVSAKQRNWEGGVNYLETQRVELGVRGGGGGGAKSKHCSLYLVERPGAEGSREWVS